MAECLKKHGDSFIFTVVVVIRITQVLCRYRISHTRTRDKLCCSLGGNCLFLCMAVTFTDSELNSDRLAVTTKMEWYVGINDGIQLNF
jgi:hypothetical protein